MRLALCSLLCCSTFAQTVIRIAPAERTGSIAKALYGTNHRFFNDGVGSWDPVNARIREGFTSAHRDAGLGSIRYPGGTAGNLFEWKKAIGPVASRRPIHRSHGEVGKVKYLPSAIVSFGVDECAQWCRRNNVEMVYMYNMANGSAEDAADLVEYLNAPLGTNPNGGTAWAEVRARNGSPEPYNIRYFEIGNEMNGPTQRFWLEDIEIADKEKPKTFQEGLNAFSREYAFGGIAAIRNEPLGEPDNFDGPASLSSGAPNQRKALKFAPVIAGSEAIAVAGETWTRVQDLAKSGPDRVYSIDPATGVIRFGDGTHGAIPPKGAQITATYRTRRDGFAAYVRAMKTVDPRVKVYSGYESQRVADAMGSTHDYDGIVIHPYTKQHPFPKGIDGDEFHHRLMVAAENRTRHVGEYIETMRKKVGPARAAAMSAPVTEYGLIQLTWTPFPSIPKYIGSFDQALYIAQSLFGFARLRIPFANKHSTIGGADGVIGDAPAFRLTPTALVFKTFTHMAGQEMVRSEIAGNPVRALGDGTNMKKLDALATIDERGRVTVLVLNRDAKDAVTAGIEGVPSGDAEIWMVEGATYTAPDATIRTEKAAVNVPFNYTFKPHSLTAIRFSTGGGR